ncbi:MAG: hypothetical protein J6I68_16960 [Butyrivibrio sp.]|uniref:hypothetical protein n=1 Tax=Butyrivibrio sp. TaxID=28121 RepID=UPI001B55C3E1|nr:hypothetical protein [Butyrivibrio sp.]MBP3784928.1 hypothetical protein [Butyrivibrio sp.]
MAHKIFGDARIMEAYTLNSYFLTLSPWFEGDSMVASFVKKGTKGKDNVTVYISLKKFEKLVESIKNRSLLELIKKDDKDDNPGAWTYRTGNNGSKLFSLGLGAQNSKTGKRSITFHGYDATKKANANVPITWEDLEDMVWAYELVVGKEPEDNAWHKMLYDAFWSAYEDKKKHYEKTDEDEESVTEEVQEAAKEPVPQGVEGGATVVTLSSFSKEGDVISFNGKLDDTDSVFRIGNSEISGKDKDRWNALAKDVKKSPVKVSLNLHHVRGNEYTILGIA